MFNLNDRPMSPFQILIVAICFILNFNDGIDVLIVSFSSTDIIAEFGLTKAQMGYIFSAGLAGMTAGALLLAPWADKIGRRKMFIISLCFISSGMFGVALTHSYVLMLAFRFLTGLGIGGILPTMAATAAEFSNNKYRDFNVGLVQAGWPVGAILTGFFCKWFISLYGWHTAFLLAGCLSFLMLALVYFYMTDSVEFLLKTRPDNALVKVNALLKKLGQAPYDVLPTEASSTPKASAKELFSELHEANTIKLWVGAFFGFMTLYTLMSWVPNITKDAGIVLNLGAAIGSASIGALGSRFGLRQSQVTFMVLAFLGMQLYANILSDNALIFVLIFFIGIFVQGGFNGIWPILARIYPAEIRTTGVGFTVGVGRFGAILGPSIFGILSDNGLTTSQLFVVFSIPLLLMGTCIWLLKMER